MRIHVFRREEDCGQESDGDGGAGEKNERKTEGQVHGWITSRTTCRRESCQGGGSTQDRV